MSLYKIGISKEDNECSLALAEMMRQKGISTTDEVVELISDNQLKLFPPCFVELIQKNETKRIGKIVGLADYYVSPLSENGYYFPPQVLESFLQVSGLDDITTIIPGFYDDIILDFLPSIYRYMRLYDITGANIERDNIADSTSNPPPTPVVTTATTSGDTATTTPTPEVTTDTTRLEEFKQFLKSEYPTKNFENPVHIGGNQYKIDIESEVTFHYENGKFIAK